MRTLNANEINTLAGGTVTGTPTVIVGIRVIWDPVTGRVKYRAIIAGGGLQVPSYLI